MWQPDPSWTSLPAAGGTATVGLWRGTERGAAAIIKRFRRPAPDDPPLLSDRSHAGYWRREIEVALDPSYVDGPGLVPPAFLRCEEDEEGATLWSEEVVAEPPPALFVARSLGRFAAAPVPVPVWAAE